MNKVNLLPVEVRDVSNDQMITDKAWIKSHTSATNAEPEMPKLEARILGVPDNLSVEWRLDLTYERRGVRDDLSLPLGDAEEPGFEVYGETPWRLWQEFPSQPDYEFVGGDCVLSYQILGVPGAPEGEIKFQMLGENPDDARCKAHIIANQGTVWYAWAIANMNLGKETSSIISLIPAAMAPHLKPNLILAPLMDGDYSSEMAVLGAFRQRHWRLGVGKRI